MINSEEKCVTQSEPNLVQDMALLHDIPTPPQTISQPMTRAKRFYYQTELLQGKLIPITHASWREILTV